MRFDPHRKTDYSDLHPGRASFENLRILLLVANTLVRRSVGLHCSKTRKTSKETLRRTRKMILSEPSEMR